MHLMNYMRGANKKINGSEDFGPANTRRCRCVANGAKKTQVVFKNCNKGGGGILKISKICVFGFKNDKFLNVPRGAGVPDLGKIA